MFLSLFLLLLSIMAPTYGPPFPANLIGLWEQTGEDRIVYHFHRDGDLTRTNMRFRERSHWKWGNRRLYFKTLQKNRPFPSSHRRDNKMGQQKHLEVLYHQKRQEKKGRRLGFKPVISKRVQNGCFL